MQNPLSRVALGTATVQARAQRALGNHGVAGTAKIALRRASPRPARCVEYVLYGLDLQRPDRPRPPLEAGLTLRQGGLSDVPALAEMERHLSVSVMTESLARSRIKAGHTPWVVFDRGEGLFQCWILEDHIPVNGVDGGRIRFPDGVLGLEDSIAAAAARGRGIAPAAWGGIADHLQAQGAHWLLTKIDLTNVPSRKAIVKAGFDEVARVRIVRRDWLVFIRVALAPGQERFGWLRNAERN